MDKPPDGRTFSTSLVSTTLPPRLACFSLVPRGVLGVSFAFSLLLSAQGSRWQMNAVKTCLSGLSYGSRLGRIKTASAGKLLVLGLGLLSGLRGDVMRFER